MRKFNKGVKFALTIDESIHSSSLESIISHHYIESSTLKEQDGIQTLYGRIFNFIEHIKLAENTYCLLQTDGRNCRISGNIYGLNRRSKLIAKISILISAEIKTHLDSFFDTNLYQLANRILIRSELDRVIQYSQVLDLHGNEYRNILHELVTFGLRHPSIKPNQFRIVAYNEQGNPLHFGTLHYDDDDFQCQITG